MTLSPTTEVVAFSSALPARRRGELMRLVRSNGQIAVGEIAAMFEVSADTIRRDLDFLAARGLLSRTHGGAVAAESLVGADSPYTARLLVRKEAKNRIGQAAARLIADGETLVINGGSTTLAFAAALTERHGLTVVTNHIGLLSVLTPRAVRNVYLLGGEWRAEAYVTLGTVGFAGIGAISADTAVIGVGGISGNGLSATLLAEASMIAEMIATAKRTLVLADSSKFGHNAFAQIAALEVIDVLVTDAAPEPAFANLLKEAGVEIVYATPTSSLRTE